MSLRKQVRSKKYMDEVFQALELGERSRYGRPEFNELGGIIDVKFVGGVGTAEAIDLALAGETPEPEPEEPVAVYVDTIFLTGTTTFTGTTEICQIGDVSDLDDYQPKVLIYGPLGGEFTTVFEEGDFVYLDEEFETPVDEGFITSYIDGTWYIIEVGEDGEILSIDEFNTICVIE
jgi:hypothetical protein